MEIVSRLFAPPVHFEAWLVIGYVAVVLAGARLVEAAARLHFARARRYAEAGFAYVADADHYRCPEGERLERHAYDGANRLALYRARADICNACSRKAACTPHDEGRHIYRSLAAWAETDLGRFHQRLSLLLFTVAALLSGVGLLSWGGEPGTGLLLLALAASLSCLAYDLRAAWAHPAPDPDEARPHGRQSLPLLPGEAGDRDW